MAAAGSEYGPGLWSWGPVVRRLVVDDFQDFTIVTVKSAVRSYSIEAHALPKRTMNFRGTINTQQHHDVGQFSDTRW
jgi:hypothetical protein